MAAGQTGNQTGNTEEQGDLSDIKRKLAWRMGIAGLMIVGLLGGLALFDRLSAPSAPEPTEPQFTEAVPVAKKVVTQAVTPAEPSTEAAKVEANPPSPESSAAPVEPPPPPVVSAQPALPRASQPAVRAIAASAPSTSSKPPVPAVAAKSAEPSLPMANSPTSSTSPPPAAESPSKPLLSKLLSGFAVQAGVFSDPRRAEELQAKLLQEGIPSSIEARVEVGPFKTRAEAQAAREKMKALGIDTVLLLPKGTKR